MVIGSAAVHHRAANQPLCANIDETIHLVLITEQGENSGWNQEKISAMVGTPVRNRVRQLLKFIAALTRQARPVINWLRVGVHIGVT